MKIVFIGLGRMGFPMAGHLAKAGCDVTVFNRSVKKSKLWTEKYNRPYSESLSDLPNELDMVITCLKDDTSISDILSNENLVNKVKPGGFIVDHSTTSVELVRELYTFYKSNNITFYDSPVSGGELGAQNGQLSVMIGGDDAFLNQIKPIIQYYASAIEYIGLSGSGQLTKMINQICITGVIKSLSEAINFAKAQEGLDLNKVFNAISSGAAQSWQLDNRFHTMVKGEFDFGFGIDLMIKDLKIAINQANRNNVPLKTVQSILDEYIILSEMGGGDQDTSSLIKSLQNT
jgi:3-hydroxyisobutyrate dehydrogenase-like beta-hydroxyacid dehydrogenase